MTFPSFSQWKQLFKVLKKREKISLTIFFLIAIASLGFFVTSIYLDATKQVPALGGTYIEGVVGQPRFINPVYGETNDTDRTLIDLVYSGLMTYDSQGKIVKDLADSYTVSDDGKTYDFQLKKTAVWQDGKPLTADDVVFTIKTLQNSDYKSPLRANWIDVDVEKISDSSVRFLLKSPYNAFLENCTVKIIPQHIWGTIAPENFILSVYNLQPVGSGPFQFADISQTNTGFIKSISLASNRHYYNQPSHLEAITFDFFEKKDDLIQAANAKQINGFTLAAFDNSQAAAESQIHQGWPAQSFSVYNFSLPRYFAVFFNMQKDSLFSDSNVRQAMIASVNTSALITKISAETKNPTVPVDSPILPDFYGYQAPQNPIGFNEDQAKKLLGTAGFADNGSGILQKSITKKLAFQFKSYLKIGSKGTEVTQLQACLNRINNGAFSNLLNSETTGKFGSGTDAAVTAFQKQYLPDAKPTGETGTATRQQLNTVCFGPQQNSQPLQFTLVTVDQPQLIEVANLLKQYWQSVGADVTINAVSLTDLKPIIKDRTYDALLYGQALGAEPDLYPFWHSSQIQDPGLNLSEYQNTAVDKLLEDARSTLDASKKEQDLEQIQNDITSDAPALFLYNPNYSYWVSAMVHGIDTAKIIDPAKRFSNVTQWYIDTKRVLK